LLPAKQLRYKSVRPLTFAGSLRAARFPNIHCQIHKPSLVVDIAGCYAVIMANSLIRKISAMELEEQILNAGALMALIGVFFPWVGGEWLGGESVTYAGFSFYTGFMGIAVLLLELFILLITIIPLTGGPALVRKGSKDTVRLLVSAQAAILILASLSVLTKTTLEFARMELRFGIYISLVGSLVALLYSFLRFQEKRRREVHNLFHHPEEETFSQNHNPSIHSVPQERAAPQAPPPPEAPAADEHRFHSP